MNQHEQAFECAGCGKQREDLPDHWSEVTVLDAQGNPHSYLHHCLECRSQKEPT